MLTPLACFVATPAQHPSLQRLCTNHTQGLIRGYCCLLSAVLSAALVPATPPARKPPPSTTNPLDIVFVSAEVAPWSKTGGLGDVMGALPQAMAERGHRVMVVSPRSEVMFVRIRQGMAEWVHVADGLWCW
jgi:hypothetical protein